MNVNSNFTSGELSPVISVIVCTYNREKVLGACCRSLVEQSCSAGRFEVIIADNGSTDNTRQIITKFIEDPALNHFRTLNVPEVGLSHARNAGVAAASGEFVAFIDDDARAPAHWIEEACRIIRAENPDIFGGPAYPLFPDNKPEWFKESYAIRGEMGPSGPLKEDGFLIGTNIFFRKSLIENYGGFNPELGMRGNQIAYHEETHLINRARAEGHKIWYSNELAVRDLIPDYKLNLPFVIYSKYRAGKDIWKTDNPGEMHATPEEFFRMFDRVMEEFNTALMKRDMEKYPYPENYIFENVRHHFYFLGKMAEYFRRNKE